MNNSVFGLDIAKNIFHLFTLLVDGKTLKKKLKRSELLTFFAIESEANKATWKRMY